MISTKSAFIMAVLASFVSGAFLASPELRAYAIAKWTSDDIVDETIQSIDIKDGEVMSSDIAADAVGAREIAGVTKLLFSSCKLTDSDVISPGSGKLLGCSFPGAEEGDRMIVQLSGGNTCFAVTGAQANTDIVILFVRNVCPFSETIGGVRFSAIVYDT